jgi:hypothetical protein
MIVNELIGVNMRNMELMEMNRKHTMIINRSKCEKN